jgi:leader peptidase (prepilin peptidase)/N-methyltransferase
MPHLPLILFVFVLGACVGSFLNVIVWRLPRGESLVTPPSHCPKCNTPLAWYDNVPVFGWIMLGGRCRYCKEPISARYPIVEAITGLLFAAYYVIFFMLHKGLSCSPGMQLQQSFLKDWPVYMLYMWLIAALLAETLIDLELYIIEPSVVWTTAVVAVLFHTLVDHPATPGTLTTVAPSSAALAAGAAIGWAISGILYKFGLLPQSFPQGEPLLEAQREEIEQEHREAQERGEEVEPLPPFYTSWQIRAEMRKEMLFLMPALLLGAAFVVLTMRGQRFYGPWMSLYGHEWVRGMLGSLLGAMVGGFCIWLIRILGTLGFGRVGMGLGDADLMVAIGAVLGAGPAVVAFFIAPFCGILVAIWVFLFRKHREIPYGPYLSLAAAIVMVIYCPIEEKFGPGLRVLGDVLWSTVARHHAGG